jgi:hypothetical protein
MRTRTSALTAVIVALPLALMALAAPARAEPLCDQPEPPPICGEAPEEESGDPVGGVSGVMRVPGGVRVQGWAQDPDTSTPISVRVTIPPHQAANLQAGGASHDGRGFSGIVPAHPGERVCVTALNVGAGSDRSLGCRAIRVQPHPIGELEGAQRVENGIRVRGWALDPDTTGPIDIHLHAGGQFTAALRADQSPSLASGWVSTHDGYGAEHGFDGVVTPAADSPNICAYGINVEAGTANTQLGCRRLPPASPSDLQVTGAHDQELWVDWQDDSSHEDGYDILVQRADGSWYLARHVSAVGGVRGRVAVPVRSSGRHCVMVRAVNEAGTSAAVEGCGETRATTRRVSLLTLNLRGLHEWWGGNEKENGPGTTFVPWRERYERVAEWMQNTNTLPDVLALQEVPASKHHFWGGFLEPRDYETLFLLIERIKARTGADYRIAYLGTDETEGWNVLSQGKAVLYNAARLRNTTPAGGDTAVADKAASIDSLHARRSYSCDRPPTGSAAMCSSLDGAGVYWTASYLDEARNWNLGPAFSSFELLADPGSHVSVYNVHAPNAVENETPSEPSRYYGAVRRFIRDVENHWGSRTRLYPPIVLGDFNTTRNWMEGHTSNEGEPFEDFEIAAYSRAPEGPEGDVVGILKGEPRVFAARDPGIGFPQLVPVEGGSPYCGSIPVLWSDHCGVYTDIVPSRDLPPGPRNGGSPAPTHDPEADEDPPVCRVKPLLPQCGP